MDNKLISLLEKHQCIHRKENITLSAGKSTNIYYDIKKATGIPELFMFITSKLDDIIPKNSSIVAVSTGGIPYSAALSYKRQCEFAYVRSHIKNYGMNNMIEGVINTKKQIYIIDDVCTTGTSILKVEKYIKSIYPYANTNLVCIIDRSITKNNILSIEKI